MHGQRIGPQRYPVEHCVSVSSLRCIPRFATLAHMQYSGPINTPMMRQTDDTRGNIEDMDFTTFLSLKRLGEVEDVANLIEFLLSDKSSFITGATINIDGGWI